VSFANHDNKGFVLVSVLWIVAILTVVALGFARRAMIERQMAWYALDREQAQHLARAAAERGIVELINKAVLDDYNGQAGYTALNQKWAKPVNMLRQSNFLPVFASKGASGDECTYRIHDSSGRISLNTTPPEIIQNFEMMDFRVARELLARRKKPQPDDQAQLFLSIEELRTFAEIDDEVWYGTEDTRGLRELITVWGDGRLNINTTPIEVLAAIPKIDPDVLDAIVEYRNGGDGILGTRDDKIFKSMLELPEKLKVSAEKLAVLDKYCKTTGFVFTIEALATRRQGKINAFCDVTVTIQGDRADILQWRENPIGT
jgi:general secretion pathway protein K